MDALELVGWKKVTSHKYRHYCGSFVVKNDKLWNAITVDGIQVAGHKNELEAAAYLAKNDPSFWTYGRSQSGGLCGGVVDTIQGCLDGNWQDGVFVFFSKNEKSFPTNQIRSAFEKYMFGKAICVKCSRPMTSLQLRVLPTYDRNSRSQNAYIACECGHPVWRLDFKAEYAAHHSILRASYSSFRRQSLKTAGGKHSVQEIQEILASQVGRCIYCDIEFTDEIRPTKDHLLPVVVGGAGWALNIVMSCRRCNSRRGDIPFRTYCKLLSPSQNKKILMHLHRRIAALDLEALPDEAFENFYAGLSDHDPRHERYLDIQRISTTARRNATINKILPRTPALIMKRAKFDASHK